MKKINRFRASDIKLSKDSQDYYTATHLYHRTLIDSVYFPSRKEAQAAAKEVLQELEMEESFEDYDDLYPDNKN